MEETFYINLSILGYNICTVPMSDLLIEKNYRNRHKIGYVESDTCFIAEDCVNFLKTNYHNTKYPASDSFKVLIEAIALILIKRSISNITEEEAIYDVRNMINYNKNYTNSRDVVFINLFDIISDLKLICDNRVFSNKEYL